MHELRFSRLRRRVTALVWKHGHGSVPRHHLLHRADLPSISCWWDAFVLPLLTWGLLGRVRNRPVSSGMEAPWTSKQSASVLLGFAGAMLFGGVLAGLFAGLVTLLGVLLYRLIRPLLLRLGHWLLGG